MEFLQLDPLKMLEYFLKLAAAFALALPVAWERERATRIMGLRTFPLVSIASCSFALISIAVVGAGEDAQARIIQGLMTGIGFIGGGAILKEGATVRGTATAASIWSIGALGAAVAYGRFEIAILLSLANFLTLRFLTPLQQRIGKADRVLDDEANR
jgi:putative Mg2+ transporter-C (MgtC) family protein